MKLKRITRSAVTALAMATVALGLNAGTASAATYVSVWGAEGRYDNNPGNGAASWIWVYTGDNSEARLTYILNDGSRHELTATGTYSSATASLNQDVRTIQVCTNFPTPVCSAWS
ncbi:hypothetical protein ABZ387_25230 [Streptomyces flaveolus]|uniref:hypothetical protein n=1 Tax=Streptomyces flaveolus TaxID=67297 RepID=UPI0033D1E2EC